MNVILSTKTSNLLKQKTVNAFSSTIYKNLLAFSFSVHSSIFQTEIAKEFIGIVAFHMFPVRLICLQLKHATVLKIY